MSGTDSTADSDPRSVDLAAFVESHSPLLVVMGVFAAVAVYISQSAPSLGTNTDAELIYTTGFVSSLGMTMLFLLLVYKELAKETESWNNLHYAHYRLDNFPLALFTLFNGMLILSMSFLLLRYEPAIFILVLIATVYAGYGIVFRLVHYIARILPRSARVRIPVLLLVSVVSVVASDFVLTEYLAEVHLMTIHELSLSEPIPVLMTSGYVLIGSIRAAGALGVVIGILSIPFVAFEKLRGKSPYDNPE